MLRQRPTVERNAGVEVRMIPHSETLPQAFWNRVNQAPERIALRFKHLGIWNELSWEDFGRSVRACAFGLMALGVEKGNSVAILSDDRVEWFFSDLGALCAGAVSVGVYSTNSAAQCRYVVEHSDAAVWIVENQEQYDKVAEVRDQLPFLRYVIVIDPTGVRGIKDRSVMTFDALLARGRLLEDSQPELLDQRMGEVEPDDSAILFYTSGSTGYPKGTTHSHRSFLAGMEAMAKAAGTGETDEGVCYMPLAHLMERVISLSSMIIGGSCGSCAESPETVFQDMAEIAPTHFGAAPRTWERLKARIELEMAEATSLKQKLYQLALRTGESYQDGRLNGGSLSRRLRVLHFALSWSVLRKLRERIGLHRLRIAYSGAAPISSEVLRFFRALGVPLKQAYGMTETGVTAVTPPGAFRYGTVGAPVDGVEFKLTDDRELVVRGPGLMIGYLKDPETTAQTMKNGWLKTGDVGWFDEDGFLYLKGRASEMMITSAGRNVHPQQIENQLKASNYIMDAVLVGEARPYLTALIAIDEETVSHFAQTQSIPFSSFASLVGQPEIVALIDQEVRKVNLNWSDREQIRDFRILKWELSHDEEELTPTLKIRRKIICETYSDLIEEMYPNG